MSNTKDNFDYRKYYEEDARFKRYVDRHCKEYDLSLEEALQHEIVKETAHYYTDAIKDKITENGIVVGCGGADAPMKCDCE